MPTIPTRHLRCITCVTLCSTLTLAAATPIATQADDIPGQQCHVGPLPTFKMQSPANDAVMSNQKKVIFFLLLPYSDVTGAENGRAPQLTFRKADADRTIVLATSIVRSVSFFPEKGYVMESEPLSLPIGPLEVSVVVRQSSCDTPHELDIGDITVK